jgi:hypothetical protein
MVGIFASPHMEEKQFELHSLPFSQLHLNGIIKITFME